MVYKGDSQRAQYATMQLSRLASALARNGSSSAARTLSAQVPRRFLASATGDGESNAVTEGELVAKLTEAFAPHKLEVVDSSGGCGAMFEVHIVSDRFVNLSRVRREMLVNKAIKSEIARMHGIRINALAPEQASD